MSKQSVIDAYNEIKKQQEENQRLQSQQRVIMAYNKAAGKETQQYAAPNMERMVNNWVTESNALIQQMQEKPSAFAGYGDTLNRLRSSATQIKQNLFSAEKTLGETYVSSVLNTLDQGIVRMATLSRTDPQTLRVEKLLSETSDPKTLFELANATGRQGAKRRERLGVSRDDLQKAYQTVSSEQVQSRDLPLLQKQAEDALQASMEAGEVYADIERILKEPMADYSGDEPRFRETFRATEMPKLREYAQAYNVLLDESSLDAYIKSVQTLAEKVHSEYLQKSDWNHEADAMLESAQTIERQRGRIENAERATKKYEPLRKNPDFAEISAKDMGTQLYDMKIWQAAAGSALPDADQLIPIGNANQEEAAMFRYLYHTQGAEAAGTYLREILPILNDRYAGKLQAATAQATQNDPLNANLASVLMTLGTARSYGKAAAAGIMGQEIDPNSGIFAPNIAKQTVRGTSSEGIKNAVGGFAGDTLSFLYDAGMSLVDSAAAGAALGPGGLAVLGLSAASDTTYDVLQRGGSTEQALIAGGLAGAAEAAFEKIGLDELFGAATDGARKSLIKQGLRQAGIEGAEETLTELSNFISDRLVMGELSKYSSIVREGISDGLSREEAEQRAIQSVVKDIALAFLGGFVSGGFGGAVSAAVGNAQVKSAEKAFTNELYEDEETRAELLATADSLPGTEAQAYAQKLKEKKNVSGADYAKLRELNEKVLQKETETIIEQRSAEAEVSPEAQNALVRMVRGEALSEQDAEAIRETSDSRNLFADLTKQEISEETASEEIVSLAKEYGKGASFSAVQGVQSGETAQVENYSAPPQNAAQGKTEAASGPAVQRVNAAGVQAVGTADRNESETSGNEPLTLESASKKYGAQAGAMIHTYKPGQDVRKYDRAYQLAYDMGQSGVSLSYAKTSDALSYLTQNQIRNAYEAGEAASTAFAQTQDAQNRAAVGANAGTGTRGVGTVKLEGMTASEFRSTLKSNKMQKTAYRSLSFLARATGINIVLYKSSLNAEGVYEGAQGKFQWKDDTVHIDLNAGLLREGDIGDLSRYTMLRTFSHEFTHFIEKWNPVRYNEFRKLVFSTLEARGENVDALILEKQSLDASGKMTYEEASREVVAEAMTDILPDSNFVQALAQKHQRIFRKLLEQLKSFLANLRSYFAELGSNQSREANALKEQVGDTVRYLEDIVKLFDEIAVEAVETYQAATAVENQKTSETAELGQEEKISRQIRNKRTNKDTYDSSQRSEQNANDTQGMDRSGTQNPTGYSDGGSGKERRSSGGNEIKRWSDLKRGSRTAIIGKVRDTILQSSNSYELSEFLSFYDSVESAYEELAERLYTNALIHPMLAENDLAVIGKGVGALVRDILEIGRQDSDVLQEERVQNQARGRDTEPYSYNSLVQKPDMTVTVVTDSVTYNRKEIVSLALKNAASVGYTNKNGNAVVPVHDISTDVIVPKRSLVHGLDRRMNTQAPVLVEIGNVLQNSVRVNELLPRAEGIKNAYVLIGAARNQDGKLYIASFVVNKYSNEVSEIDVLYSANAKKESAALLPKLTGNPATPTDSTISIANLLSYVNEYFPDILPEGVLRHFGHESRPAGELGESVLYQPRSEALTDREVLEQAAETVSDKDLSAEERKALQRFREKLPALQILEDRRAALGKQYRTQQVPEKGQKADREGAEKTLAEMRKLDREIRQSYLELLPQEEKRILDRVLQIEKRKIERREREKASRKAKMWRDRRTNSEEIRKYRTRLERDVKDMTDWILKPDAKNPLRQVPEVLREAVIPFLSGFDFSSKQQLKGGALTKNDEDFLKRFRALWEVLKPSGSIENLYGDISDLPPDFADQIQPLIDSVKFFSDAYTGDYLVNEMTSNELEILSDLVRELKQYIMKFNKFHLNTMFQHASEAGGNSIDTLSPMQDAGQRVGAISDYLLWKQMRPANAFERFGDGGRSIWDELRRGQATLAFDSKAIIDFSKEAYETKEVQEWENEIKEIKLGEDTVRIPVSMIMSLYELSKRPQALTHILGQGIRVSTFKQGTRKISDKGHLVTEDELQKILDTLTKRQRDVADKLQQFMQKQGGKWGNYVSMRRFGVEQFGEDHYFPINSDGRYLPANSVEQPDTASLYALLNMGFTKKTVEKAKNRLVLYSIFDVFANHMAQMAQYHAFALPIVDAMKWFNYRTETDSLRDQMDRVYGVPEEKKPGSGKRGYAQSFIINILKAFNGTEAQGDPTDTVALNQLRRYNMAQVAYNLRVVAQQPIAVTRAGLLLDYRSILLGLQLRPAAIQNNIAEMQEYSGIAAWKSLGFYDVNISRGLTELIKHETSAVEKIGEFGMKGAELADRVTWAAIWNASKIEVQRKQKLKPQDAGFYPAVTKLFEEVIYKTQVVDSVLTKSEFMRSKGFWAKAVSSFMSEPVTSASMLIDAFNQYSLDRQNGMSKAEAWRKNRKKIGRTVYVYALSQVLLAAAQAASDAWRDDDDYKTLVEKWLSAFKGNIIDELMPLNKLPVLSDLYELSKQLLQAFGVDTYGNSPRTVTMQWAEPLIKGLEILVKKIRGEEGNYTWYGGAYKLLQAVSGGFGFPLATLTREAVTAWNNIAGAFAPGLKVKTYELPKQSELRYAYQDGDITKEEAMQMLLSEGLVEDEDDAYFLIQKWDSGEKEYSRFGALYDAVFSGSDATAAQKELLAHGYKEKDLIGQIKGEIGKRYREETITRPQAVKALKGYTDLSDKEIETLVNKWTSTLAAGIDFDDIKGMYLDGELTEKRAIDLYAKFGGYSEEEATKTVKGWDRTATIEALAAEDPRVKEAAQAKISEDYQRYKQLFQEIRDENNYTFDVIMAAVDLQIREISDPEADAGYEAPERENEAQSVFDVSDYYEAILDGKESDAEQIGADLVEEKRGEGFLKHEAETSLISSFVSNVKQDYLSQAFDRARASELLMKYGGMESEDEAASEIEKWNFELDQGYSWASRARGYRLGHVSKETLIDAVMKVEGSDREEAEDYIDFLNLEMTNEDISISASEAASYFKYAEPAGIDVESYLNYKERAAACEGEKDSEGNTISGSKKEQILYVIDSMPISNAQKDALYYANDWAESKLYLAPWH